MCNQDEEETKIYQKEENIYEKEANNYEHDNIINVEQTKIYDNLETPPFEEVDNNEIHYIVHYVFVIELGLEGVSFGRWFERWLVIFR